MKMKKLSLLLLFAFALGSISYGQLGIASATYDLGDIETDKYFTYYSGTQSSDCPGLLTVTLPADALILYTDVSYDMTSDENSTISKQKSHFRCVSPGGINEATHTSGPNIYTPGTESYSRPGLDIANDVVGGGNVDFELHAGASYYKHWCTLDSVKVDNNTWTVTITYIPSGFSMQALNPTPVDGGVYVGLDDDLTWDFGADTDTYDVYFGTDNPPTTQVVFDELAGATGTYDPGTMNETETYYWQVVSKNTNGYTSGPVWSFTTVCGSFLTPFTEDFENVTIPELPYCWTKIVNSTSTAYLETNGYYGNFGPNCITMGNNNDAAATLIFISPQIDIGAGSLADKMVHLYVNGADYPYLNIGTMSDPTDESTFTSYETILVYQDYKEHDIYMNDYVGTDTYIAFKLDVSQSYQTAQIDDITIGDMPTCIRPEALSADNLTINSAMLHWTDLNGATSWNIEYDTAGFIPTGVPSISGVSNPHVITELNSATEYDFYVQTDCGGGDVSAWTSAATFVTPCDFYAIPFSENFDGVEWGEMPACWSSILFCADGFAWNGNQGGYFQMENSFDLNSTLMLISPPVLDIAPNRLKFNAQSNTVGAELLIGTMSNPADQNTFELLTSVTFTAANIYEPFDVWLNGYTGIDNYFVFKHSNGSTYLTIQIDDIEVEALPTCLPPSDIFVDEITTTTAKFNWTESGTATDWEIEIGNLGFTPGTGSYLNQYFYSNPLGIQSYDLTGLAAATVYDVYVRTDCGAGDFSPWTGPVTFQTSFDAFTSLPVTEDFESGMGITGNDYQNVENWVINTDLYHGGLNSIHNPYLINDDNVLFMLGTFDFTAKTDVMLTFWQIAKTDGNSDHCYVEISTDGGLTYDQLPESTYYGTGNYREAGLYTTDGPAFDEDSYADWGTGLEVPDNTWWKKEYFNLTDYNTFDNVVIRFRLWSNGYTSKAGWYIDDIAVEALGTPGFYVTPLSIEEDATASVPIVNTDLKMGNTGDFPSSFTANVVYDEIDMFSANFNSGMPVDWTIVNNGTNDVTWTDTTDIYNKNFDGTRFAWVDGLQAYLPPVTNTMDEQLISPSVNATAYASGTLQLEYDQVFDADYQPGDTARVYVYDGANWVMIYESWTDDGSMYSGGTHKVWNVSAYANDNFKVKFQYIEGSITARGRFFAIDNVRLRASMSALGWLTIDGFTAIGGVALPDADGLQTLLDVQMDATGLALGTYYSNIEVTSNDPLNPTTIIPCTLNVIPDSQEYTLDIGYKFISSRIIPENPDMMDVLVNILNENLDFVRNSSGLMLRKIGPNWVNNIGDWITTEGYLFKMVGEDVFSISGEVIDPQTPILLVEGYQFVSFLPENQIDALVAFNDVLDNLDFVRNTAGFTLIEIGPNWVNGIGDLNPGEGYLVKMNAEDILIYPVTAEKFTGIANIKPEYFNFEGGNAADPVYTMYVSGLEIGDEVAAYDGNLMVGAMKVISENVFDNSLAIFNTLTNGQGYQEGNLITLKVLSSGNIVSTDFTMEAMYDSYVSDVYPDNDGEFSVVNITKGVTLTGELLVYPNPATDEINISSPSDISNVTIINYVGQSVYSSKVNSSNVQINTNNFEAGIYIIRIQTCKGIKTKKIIIE
jgi:hypothetical protein